MSDTVTNRHDHPTYEIDPMDVVELWEARLKFSGNFQAPSEIWQRLDDLETGVSEIVAENSLLKSYFMQLEARLNGIQQ